MSTQTAERREYSFQAEIKQLLHLLSHSLYQSRDIAFRELISNASDSLDKMRYLALTSETPSDAGPLEIVIEGNEAEGTLVIRDNGVGMTAIELEKNLGSIAHSGSGEFAKRLAEGARDGSGMSLIGQFGVGFYSAFMLADRVQVKSRGRDEQQAWEWESTGEGAYTIAPLEETIERGAQVILHLKPEAREYAAPARIREIVRRYSSFIPFPIRLGEGGEILNDQKPIWVEPKSQVTEEQYSKFYQHLTHRMNDQPLWHAHLAADSPIQFRAVLYGPRTNLESMGFARMDQGLHLCAKRVLVQADCHDLLPDYLRFVEGLVDSEDLPLNVSRETLQDNRIVAKIKTALVKGVLDRLDRLAEDDADGFKHFNEQFGQVLKEGMIMDLANRERIARLARFGSSREQDPESLVSFDQYLDRMVAGQERIYYLSGDDQAALRKSPHLEIFNKRGIEVLLLTERIDEFAVTAMASYKGKRLTPIESDDLGLPEDSSTDSRETSTPTGFARVLDLFREALKDRVADVRESRRLVDNPCCLVSTQGAMSPHMQRVLKNAGKPFYESARVLEVNPRSPLIERLGRLSANPEHDDFIRESALQLWANALILEGVMPDPEAMVDRVSRLLEEVAQKRSPLIL